MTDAPLFVPARKQQLRGRVAFSGPTGSGKTMTMLYWARVLAGPEGKIAVVDTERRSARLYADMFEFDVLDWPPPYDPRELTTVLKNAETTGYDVVCTDSLTHFWKGEGGTLEIVDAVAARSPSGNKFTAWSVGTPAIRGLVDTLLGLDAHVLSTMRSKMEYVLVENDRGKKEPTRVGLAPEMQADIEYEFTVVIDMDRDHRGVVSKSRCAALADKVIHPGESPTEEAASVFAQWLDSGEDAPDLATPGHLAALRTWLNTLPPREQGRKEVRQKWPLGVPELGAPGFTVEHVEKLAWVIAEVSGAPAPSEVAAALATGDASALDDPTEGGTGTPPPDAGDPPPDGFTPAEEPTSDPQEPASGDPAPDPAPDPATTGDGNEGPDPLPLEDGTPPADDPDGPDDPGDVPDEDITTLLGLVADMSAHQAIEELKARKAALSGTPEEIHARLGRLMLADAGVKMTQGTVGERLAAIRAATGEAGS